MSYLQSFAQASLIGSLLFSSCAMATGQQSDQPKKVVISFELDEGSVSIVIRGDDVKVEMDGKAIAKDRIDIKDNWLQIKNRNGWPVAFGNFGAKNFGFNFVDAPKMHAWLGVDLRSVSDALAGHLDLDQDEVSQIVSVTPDSPAEKGGLLDHDIMLSIEGKSPATLEDLREVLADKEPGDMLTVGILRKGKERELEIELGESVGQSWSSPNFNRLIFDASGKGGVYSFPSYNQSWSSPSLLKFDQFNQAKDAYKLNQLYWGVNKQGKNQKDKSSGKDKDSDSDADNPFSVVTPQGVFYDYLVSPKTGGVGLGKVYKTGKNKTLFLPDTEVYSILGGSGQGLTMVGMAKGRSSTKALEKQLSDMAQQLKDLKALVEMQQGKNKQRDN